MTAKRKLPTFLSLDLRKARRLAAGAAVVVLLAWGVGSFAYVEAFRVEREAGVIVIAASTDLTRDAVRLGKAFAAEAAGRVVVVVDANGDEVSATSPATGGEISSAAYGAVNPVEEGGRLHGLIHKGHVDYVLAGGTGLAQLGSASLLARAPGFLRADLLTLPFPSARVSMTLDEARSALERTSSQGTLPPGETIADLTVIGLGDRTPDRQLLEVDGVYPTLANVLSGTYPLASPARLVSRRPAGPFSLAARLPWVRDRVQPNRRVLDDFNRWLASPGACSAFYGTSSEITLTAVGDVMLGRKTAREIEQNGLDFPFGLVGERLRTADITFANLESPLGTSGLPLPGKQIWLRGRPAYVECLRQAGIDVVNLANNHILDYDTPSLLETLEVLDETGIAHAGAGPDNLTARKPAILEAGGLKVAFLGYTEFADPGLFWSLSYRRTFVASETQSGCNPLDLALVAEDIALARTLADVVVVVYHWGIEDIPYPQAYNPLNDLESIARRTIDLGADVVLGTHPHAVQGYEVYRGGLIAYSLGNFVNDQKRDTQKESMILELQIGASGVLSARVTPCWIDTTRPRILTGDEARRLLDKIAEISIGFRDHR
jgi:poly-gamma-glutamate capsule biosynthesis protein CapA/YwtB (metallophosphatase superfamily)